MSTDEKPKTNDTKPKCVYCHAAFGPIISGICAYCWVKIYSRA